MTQVDFYILQDEAARARPLLTCRLTEKAWKQGHRVYINTDTQQQVAELDDLLWTFRAGSFIPHAAYTEADGELPVTLGHALEPDGFDDVLVNLANEVPPYFSRFDRVAELVGADTEQRAAARDRYRYYQDRGYTLNTHKL
ncbi:MAG: DNA polymerase III subunit chi [Gammaproteobacteria bacterium]|nr:DNA polymerase III subunit chi [Gammaproteobacteria bacterium]